MSDVFFLRHRTCQSFVIYSAKVRGLNSFFFCRRIFCRYLLATEAEWKFIPLPPTWFIDCNRLLLHIRDIPVLGKRPASLRGLNMKTRFSAFHKIHKCICVYTKTQVLSLCDAVTSFQVCFVLVQGLRTKKRNRERNKQRLFASGKKAPFHFSYHPNAHDAWLI